jgi:hypothetical protein
MISSVGGVRESFAIRETIDDDANEAHVSMSSGMTALCLINVGIDNELGCVDIAGTQNETALA